MSAVTVVMAPQALRDIERILRHYVLECGRALADKFNEAFQSAVALLAQYPRIGSPRFWEASTPDGKTVRRPSVLRTWRITGFPHLVLYVDPLNLLLVLRVRHHRQLDRAPRLHPLERRKLKATKS